MYNVFERRTKTLIRLCVYAGWFEFVLGAHVRRWVFSRWSLYLKTECRSKFIAGARNVPCFHCSSSNDSVKPNLLCLSVFTMGTYFRIFFFTSHNMHFTFRIFTLYWLTLTFKDEFVREWVHFGNGRAVKYSPSFWRGLLQEQRIRSNIYKGPGV